MAARVAARMVPAGILMLAQTAAAVVAAVAVQAKERVGEEEPVETVREEARAEEVGLVVGRKE